MVVPAGYRPIGNRLKTKAEAQRDAKSAKKHFGDQYIYRPVKAGKEIIGYQLYWKRIR